MPDPDATPPARRRFEEHRPPHDVARGEAVFLTASTYRRTPHLASPARRDRFLDLLFTVSRDLRVELVAWVVLKEHYHLIFCPEDPRSFTRWIGTLHGVSSRDWNAEDGTTGRQCWYHYRDTRLWTQGDVWSRVDYIHRNPVKHGYVLDACDWEWSSYPALAEYLLEPEPQDLARRFPAPRRLPGDDF